MERYFSNVSEALGAVDQGSYTYYNSDLERIRAEANGAEAAYDKQMVLRKEAEASEAAYDAKRKALADVAARRLVSGTDADKIRNVFIGAAVLASILLITLVVRSRK